MIETFWELTMKIIFVAIVGICVSFSAYADTAKKKTLPVISVEKWNLMTVTYGGTVSVVKGLTKKECDFAKSKLLEVPKEQEKSNFYVRSVENGDIKSAECFQ